MPIETVAILSPGDMGHAVGRLLREHELRVVTCLTGRSARTRTLAQEAGIVDIPSLEDLVRQADVILSILVSEGAPDLCQQVADAMRATGKNTLFAECNAISPQLTRSLEPLITSAGGRYVDASIIGGPPLNGSSPRLYVSGPHADELLVLRDSGLDVRHIGPEIGQASGIKMCYAAMTKGSWALYTELLMAADMLGLTDPLAAEFKSGGGSVYQRMEGSIPGMPAKSRRWISEMQQIEATFGELGLTPRIFQGVTDMYRMVGNTSLGEENPESRDTERTLNQTIHQLAKEVRKE